MMNEEKIVVEYNVDSLFLATIRFSLIISSILFIIKNNLKSLNSNDEEFFSDEVAQLIEKNANEFFAFYDKTITSEILSDSYLFEIVKRIPLLTSSKAILLIRKIKNLEQEGILKLNASEMKITYLILHLSCTSFSLNIDDLHRSHFKANEDYINNRKIIFISMKYFMESIYSFMVDDKSFIDFIKKIKEID